MSVTTSVYQSWLADRGIDSPGSQPFVLLGAGIDARSHVVILATASSVGQDIKSQVVKLAAALSTEDSAVSWVVVDEGQSMPLMQGFLAWCLSRGAIKICPVSRLKLNA